METRKFYQKTWFMVLMLFLFAPVGIFLIWKYKKFNTVARVVISILFASVFIAVIMPTTDSPDDSQNAVASSADSSEEVTPEPKKEEATPSPVQEPKTESDKETEDNDASQKNSEDSNVLSYEDGMYKVGSDIEAGEYILFTSTSWSPAYCQISSDSSGDIDSILSNANFEYNKIVTVKEGEYLTLQGCSAVPFDKSVEVDTSGGGMFKVGVHIEPGEYKIQVDEDSILGSGYIEVATDSTGNFNSIRTNDNITDSTYITVEKGEYLTLQDCHIVK